MNVKKIAEKYLKDNNYDGLCAENCGCKVGDLMPCGALNYEDISKCQPGYKHICSGNSTNPNYSYCNSELCPEVIHWYIALEPEEIVGICPNVTIITKHKRK